MEKERPSVQFTVERTYTVRRPEITLYKNVAYLDVEKLRKGSHTIELGTYEGCDSPITATVRDGMVTGIGAGCDGSVEMPRALAAKLDEARKELGGGEWQDIPIEKIVNSARIVIDIFPDGEGCFEICIGTGGLSNCWICCPDLGWCIGPSDPKLALF
jgi:hypothetical protein